MSNLFNHERHDASWLLCSMFGACQIVIDHDKYWAYSFNRNNLSSINRQFNVNCIQNAIYGEEDEREFYMEDEKVISCLAFENPMKNR